MSEKLNMKELNNLSNIGSNDNGNTPEPALVSEVISVITAFVDVTLGASILFSCSNNQAQCD